jgi:hypothetical protein
MHVKKSSKPARPKDPSKIGKSDGIKAAMAPRDTKPSKLSNMSGAKKKERG